MTILTKSDIREYKQIFNDIDGDGVILHQPRKNIIVYILRCLFTNKSYIDLNALLIGTKNTPYPETSYAKINNKFLNADGIIKPEFFDILKRRFNRIHSKINDPITIMSEYVNEEVELDGNDNVISQPSCSSSSTITQCAPDIYKLENHHNITDVNKALFDSTGDCKFYYDFKNGMEVTIPDVNINNIQRFRLFVNSKINMYPYPARLKYHCNKCGKITEVDNTIVSSNPVISCEYVGTEGKRCGGSMKHPGSTSIYVPMNMYDCLYVDEYGQRKNIQAISMIELDGNEYDCIGILISNSSQLYIHILTVQQIKKHKLNIKKIPTKHDNNILNLAEFMDKTIQKLTGCKILGMLDIKILLLMQKLYHMVSNNKDANIRLYGDSDTGKTFLFDNYCTLLYNGRYKKTNGNSVSVPSLRGSAVSNISISKGNKNRLGLLTLMDCIYIDEINMNKELMMFLRPFLLENVFSNDKADGDKIEYPKTAFVNVAENPPSEHMGLYRGLIKKEYEKLLDSPLCKQDDKEPFDEHWDLYQPLYTYTNPLLFNTIKNVRLSFFKKDVHWIDGVSLPDKDRFMGDIFLKRSIKKDSMKERSFAAMESEIDEGVEEFSLRMKLAVENINEIFEEYVTYKKIDKSVNISEVQYKIHELIIQYSHETKTRLSKYCMRIANLNRMFNRRTSFTEQDFDMVKRYLYIKDRAIYPEDMEEFKVVEPIKIDMEQKIKESGIMETDEIFDNDIGDLDGIQ